MKAPPAERSLGVGRVAYDIRDELRRGGNSRRGDGFSLRRTHRFQRDTLRSCSRYYERYGPMLPFRRCTGRSWR